jgi:UDP-N-acetyl-2-amino-2-deoxyglucuronate dehydrogenase
MRFVKKQIELAILGTGGMSQRYAALAASRPEFNLRIGFSSNEFRATRWENIVGTRCLSDIELVAETSGIDMVVIASAPYQHEQHLNIFLDKGIPILCEKPLVTNLSMAEAILKSAERRSIPVGCIFQKRLNTTTKLAKRFITKNRESIRRVEVKLCLPRERAYYDCPTKGQKTISGGGALITQGIHGLDLLLYLFGKISKVKGEISNCYHRDIEVEDTAEIDIEFIDGIKANFYVTTGMCEPNEEYKIILNSGVVNFTDGSWRGRRWPLLYRKANPDQAMLRFAQGVIEQRETELHLRSTIETYEVIKQVYRQ